ncbi:MAG: trypsin-like peptidase domain-containing protein [Planctomycetes bacterium]|nr:trypsin-like peptidase domain-containing protein [Planctomycetota bacterium]
MSWPEAYRELLPHIVRISTSAGFGTGFVCMHNPVRTHVGIATAWHVISDAHSRQQPIEFVHYCSKKRIALGFEDRIVFSNPARDSAVIFFLQPFLPLPLRALELFPPTQLSIGSEVAWVGFPRIGIDGELCFFAGHISANITSRDAYFVDGVSIHGLSGGPVVYNDGTLQIIGVVTEYHDNDRLPGLLLALDVSDFHLVAKTVNPENG